MTDTLKFRHHLKAAIRLLCPFEERDREMAAFTCVAMLVLAGVGSLVVREGLPILAALQLLLYVTGIYALVHTATLIATLVSWWAGPRPFREYSRAFWQKMASEEFFFACFRRNRRERWAIRSFRRELARSRGTS